MLVVRYMKKIDTSLFQKLSFLLDSFFEVYFLVNKTISVSNPLICADVFTSVVGVDSVNTVTRLY